MIFPDGRTVTYDFLSLLLKALKKRGLSYQAAMINENFMLTLPTSDGNAVTLRDRDVILLRKGSGLKVVGQQAADFQTTLQLSIGGQPFTVVRGWSYFDVKRHGRTFRVINTHLEPVSQAVQVAQAQELLDLPANTELPLILLAACGLRWRAKSRKTGRPGCSGRPTMPVWRPPCSS